MNERISSVPTTNTVTEEKQKLLTAAELDALVDDPDGVRRLSKRRLIELVANQPLSIGLVGVIRELLDRTDGKAPQSVSMTVKADNASKLTDDQLAALLAMLPDPIIIPPLPSKITL